MFALGPNESQFRQRKIKILTDQNIVLSGEIAHLRKLLRDALEYKDRFLNLTQSIDGQLKRLKNTHEKQKENLRQEFTATILRESEIKWQRRLIDFEAQLRSEGEKSLKQLRNQLLVANQKVSQFQKQKQEMQLYGFKMKRYEKQNVSLRDQLNQTKAHYQKQKEEEATAIRNHLSSTFREKIAVDRKNYELKINDLEKRVAELQIVNDNQEFQIPKISSEQTSQFKKIIEEKGRQYQSQLEKMSVYLQKKNQQINNLLKEKMRSEQHYRQEVNQKRELIKQLQHRLIQKQKEFSNEIFNAIERMKAAKEQQLSQYIKQINLLKEEIQRQQSLANDRISKSEDVVNVKAKQFDQERKRLNDENNLHKRRISQLSVKLKQIDGERQMGDTQMLINSIRDMDAKQDQVGGYQNGIVFLERELKKCQVKLMDRSRSIDKLYRDMNAMRSEHDAQLNQVKEKSRKEKKEFTQRILSLEAEIKQLHDKLKLKERENRKKEREDFRQKNQLQQKNAALKELVDELQRDYNRVIESKKGAEASYREQREKNAANSNQTNVLKKQKWLDLQKQKSDLQIIFRDKVEQQTLKFEQIIDEKTNLIDRLKQDLELTKNENVLLKAENIKILSEIQSNKENNKLSQYNKKIASLNLQIALTQNIYDSLIKAKSNEFNQSDLVQSFGGIDLKHDSFDADERQQLLLTFHPEAQTNKKGSFK